MIFLWRYT